MSYSDAVDALVQSNYFNTAIGNFTDSRWPWLEPFPQGFSLPPRDDGDSDSDIEPAKSGQWKFCWIAANGSDPTTACIADGKNGIHKDGLNANSSSILPRNEAI